MKGEKYMEEINIKILLTKTDKNEIILKFSAKDKDIGLINLELEDTENIKNLFLEIASLLIDNTIKIDYEKDPRKDFTGDTLLVEVAEDYVDTLKVELSEIENNEDLKKLRTEKALH